ncbi:GNAT family N-acetyltransferase [Tenacibaculum sp. 190130A14a]|uniref:GNAT family N-acetyltransferase n=1 Tax=Tenacibaculum polynesiense TaxID=3137857 RepID=A0ABM9P7F6_9FLAO
MIKTELNIKNLTNLWKVAGEAFNGYVENERTFYASMKGLAWPNRIWVNDLVDIKVAQEIQETMKRHEGMTFSYFNKSKAKSNLTFETNMYLKSVQYGMSLTPKNYYKAQKEITLVRVKDKENADLWSATFYKAFNYQINAEVILRTLNDVLYFLIYSKKELLGTVVVFVTNRIGGIHSLGVVPSKRKQGFALDIMREVLNFLKEKKIELVTLQASEMAKEMYLKLGFSVDFLMENYMLKK